MIDTTTPVRPAPRAPAATSPVAAVMSPAAGTTLITEQQVQLATAAAAALPPVRRRTWGAAITSVSRAVRALLTDSRPPALRHTPTRSVYLENAVMARAMHRL